MLTLALLATTLATAQHSDITLDHDPLNRGEFVAIVRLVSMTAPEERIVRSPDGIRTTYFRGSIVDVLDSAPSLGKKRITLLNHALPPRQQARSKTGLTVLNTSADPKPGTAWLVVGRRAHQGQIILDEELTQSGIFRDSVASLSEDECTEITQIPTAAGKLDRGNDAAATVLNTLLHSLGDLDSQNVAGTTRFLSGIYASGWIKEMDSVPFKSWMQDNVASNAYAVAAGKDSYTQVRLFALAILLGKTEAQLPFFHAFTACLRANPSFFGYSEAADLQNVALRETLVPGDDLIQAADETPNRLAKLFLISRAGFPKTEAAYRSLIGMLTDETPLGDKPFYVNVLEKLNALTSSRNDLQPETSRNATASNQWQRLREFWQKTSYPAFKALHAASPVNK